MVLLSGPGGVRYVGDHPAPEHGRRDGKGYKRHLFEAIIAKVLEQVSLGAETLTRVVEFVTAPPSAPDRLALARIERERDAALARYRPDRDSGALDRTMARVDVEERQAREVHQAAGVPAEVAVRYLRDLAATWRKAEGGSGRRMLAKALFERIDALGFREPLFGSPTPRSLTASRRLFRSGLNSLLDMAGPRGVAPTNRDGPRGGSSSAEAALAIAEQSPVPLSESHWLGNRCAAGGFFASKSRFPRPRCSPWRVET